MCLSKVHLFKYSWIVFGEKTCSSQDSTDHNSFAIKGEIAEKNVTPVLTTNPDFIKSLLFIVTGFKN